jgi:hypothetical protein
VLSALAMQDRTAAQRRLQEVRSASAGVLRCLDGFGRAYPSAMRQGQDSGGAAGRVRQAA